MTKAVLLIIDMINDGFDGWDSESRRSLVANINRLAEIFRERELPVIWVRQEFESDLSDAFLEMRNGGIRKYIKGTHGAEILSELMQSPKDLTTIKKRYSAFFKTTLDEVLERHRPACLVLAGINTHACIRTTAIDAYQRDWEVVLAQDCIASYNPDWHKSSLEYLDGRVAKIKTTDEIVQCFMDGARL
jgi:nicotinamidase-related amidase